MAECSYPRHQSRSRRWVRSQPATIHPIFNENVKGASKVHKVLPLTEPGAAARKQADVSRHRCWSGRVPGPGEGANCALPASADGLHKR
jgi:hypothetical protein